MAKINVSIAAREVTEHFAAGATVRGAERAAILRAMPAYLAVVGAVPVYSMDGRPANDAAVASTSLRALDRLLDGQRRANERQAAIVAAAARFNRLN